MSDKWEFIGVDKTYVGAIKSVLLQVDPEMISPYLWISTPLGQWRFKAGDYILIDNRLYEDLFGKMRHPKLLNVNLKVVQDLIEKKEFSCIKIP